MRIPWVPVAIVLSALTALLSAPLGAAWGEARDKAASILRTREVPEPLYGGVEPLRGLDPVNLPVPVTDFECLDLGLFDAQCWTREGVETCAEGIGSGLVIAKPGIVALGLRSLSWRPKCLSDEEPTIRLVFDPPLSWLELSMPRVGDGVQRLACWVGLRDSAGVFKELERGSWVPPDLLPDNQAWTLALKAECGEGCGIVACEVSNGGVDNVVTEEP